MNKQADRYLAEVEQRLKALPVTERIEILNEIKSHIFEKQNRQRIPVEEILTDLGTPAELARAYVTEGLTAEVKFSFRSLLRIIAFYGKAGLSGMFVVPFLAVISISFYGLAFLVPIAGLVKTLAALVGIDVPYVMIMIGGMQPPAVLSLIVALPIAALLYLAAKKLWQILKRYLAGVSARYEKVRNAIRTGG